VGVVYRTSQKSRDIPWNTYVARPVAAAVVWGLKDTAVTPNQVTFASLLVFAAAAAVLALCPLGTAWTLAGIALLQGSYVLDKADGQLARWRAASSSVGAHLDFLMDELKAFLLVSSSAVRWWRSAPASALPLVVGLFGLVAVASAISLTTFMRRPEYAKREGAPVVLAPEAGEPLGQRDGWIRTVERGGQFVLHYPSWILVPALFDRLDLFLWAYLTAHTLYLGRSLLQVVVALAR
jgi:phosphatidylglycerophosphate synthase